MTQQKYIKPFVHWAIYKKMKVRFTSRSPHLLQGIVTGTEGELSFAYDPMSRIITLPTQKVLINEYGWELETESILKATTN